MRFLICRRDSLTLRAIHRSPPGQFPARPYIIIGAVKTDNEHNVAKAVKEQQADAALIAYDHKYRTGTVAVASPGVIWNVPLTGEQTSAQLIRYK